MDKKVYNKPTLKLEVFTPNEYIASCWYIAEGDCYSGVIYEDDDDKFRRDEVSSLSSFNTGHVSHRVPANGYFKTDGPNPVSEPSLENNTSTYWWTGGNFNVTGNNPQSWGSHGWTRIQYYYYFKESNGTEHYFKKITNDNYTS